MSLRYLLLGLLENPASGYDLKQKIDSMSHLWAAESSQIYGTLRGLEQDGLLRSKAQKSEKGPDRRVYSRTRAGQSTLDEWLDSDPEVGQERLSVLAQIHFLCRARDPAEARTFLQRVRERFAARLAQYEARRSAAEHEDPKADLLGNLALDLGLKTLRARVEWCDEAIAKLGLLTRAGRPRRA